MVAGFLRESLIFDVYLLLFSLFGVVSQSIERLLPKNSVLVKPSLSFGQGRRGQ
jgi:hypothetical protein